ncbi:MAG: glucose-6-phosphate isomerase [Aestuariivita sp.]|nr:glucose-6-phosphate isomerase [Aestuariivita sp.]
MFSALKSHWFQLRSQKIIDLFGSDTERVKNFSIRFNDLYFDYSKTLIDPIAKKLLIDLCESTNLKGASESMLVGDPINSTENRAVLHSALRNLNATPIYFDRANIMPSVLDTLGSMEHFANNVRNGSWCGSGGKISEIVNIGIGGSDLGPSMATSALSPYHDGPRCHFVSNIDGAHITEQLRNLNPRKTLLIISSKTFTTIETMTNAITAKNWLLAGGGDPARQIVAISSALSRTADFGIPDNLVFGFANWVGGRFSLWGPTGLPLMLAIGPEDFRSFLRGGYEVDQHFKSTDWSHNLPVMLALVGIWHHQICDFCTRAILPYDQRLALLPSYLQQLEMESNGKGVTKTGNNLEYPAGPIVWGAPGTNGQHAFFQLLHQGKQIVPCEFMVAINSHEAELSHHHHLLIANCLAQSEALMLGCDKRQTEEHLVNEFLGKELAFQVSHRTFSGNRPSTTLIYPKLTPKLLGNIIAIYEYRVFVEGIILNINSFDQWGVELGKKLALQLSKIISGQEISTGRDPSTQALIDFVRQHQIDKESTG